MQTQKQILTQEEQTNTDIIRRTVSEKKTTLPSLMNKDRRTVMSKTEKVNHLLTIITELGDLMDAGAKLVYEKSGVSLKPTD